MKIKKGFVLQKVSGSYLACATGKVAGEFSGLVRMNETGVFIWNLLSEDISEEKIVEKMVEGFGISPEIAEADVKAFVKNLRDNGILEI